MKLIFALSMSLMFLSEHIVYGYLDPGSGAGLIAFLVAILVGLLFYSKKIFYKIRSKNKESDASKKDDK